MSVRTRWLLLACAAAILVGHSLIYNFVTDDAYISFVYSRNLAEHGELSFNLGHPVEGYTNFSWTVLLGLLMLLKIPPEISSRVVSTLCALGTLWLTFRIVSRALGSRSPWAVVAPILLACSSGFACWTSGGLETQLFTVLVTGALDALVAAYERPRAIRRMGVLLAFASMTRPEGPLVAAAFGAARYIQCLVTTRRWLPGKDELWAAAWFLGLWGPWFAWRWWYYGYPFPNTYYVKATGPWVNPRTGRVDPAMGDEMIAQGYYYLRAWLTQTRLVYALPFAAIGLAAPDARTPRFALTFGSAILALVYLPYAVSVGGDFMGLHRFIMPMFVIAAIAVVLGLETVFGRCPRVAAAVTAVVVLAFAATQIELTRDSTLSCAHRDLAHGPDHCVADHGVIDTPAFLMVYTEDRAKIGRAMKDCFRPDDFSILGGAGAQPYFAEMRGIDVFGLVSETIAHNDPRTRARAGHTKWGSSTNLAAYDPTFVFSCYKLHDTPTPPPLGCGWPGFEPITMHIPGLLEQGEYYTFLAKKSRHFDCPGRVK
jgi:hypothetical protein